MAKFASKLGWKLYGSIIGLLTTIVTRKVINAVWTKSHGGPPPANPEQRDVGWTEALTWTLASTAGIAVSKVVAGRIAAGSWEKATGDVPPGFEVSADTGKGK